MKTLAVGEANAAISILHAMGLGKGCSIGIDLKVTVRLVSQYQEIEDDFHSLLDSIVIIWTEQGLPLPDNFGWEISSNIPIGQGLKSSSAVSCAAIKALNLATWAGLSDSEIVNLSVSSQRHAGCTVTGSMDDSWASISPGWKLVDPYQTAEQSVLIKGELEEDYCVFLILRGKRINEISSQKFKNQLTIFERALSSLSNGSIFHAMSANGMAVAAATDDDEALRICNNAIANGALSAAITGSGPAISVVCFLEDKPLIREVLSRTQYKVIESNFQESDLEEVIE
jgi:shikimate kinase|tara:strand:+ start:65 stop:919 length:855 start_codon:yes stop_codon:yes gene_type:complete